MRLLYTVSASKQFDLNKELTFSSLPTLDYTLQIEITQKEPTHTIVKLLAINQATASKFTRTVQHPCHK